CRRVLAFLCDAPRCPWRGRWRAQRAAGGGGRASYLLAKPSTSMTDRWAKCLILWWARQGSDLGPLPCQGKAFPLRYAPGPASVISAPFGPGKDRRLRQAASILWTSLTSSRRCTGLESTLAFFGAAESELSATAAKPVMNMILMSGSSSLARRAN